MPNCFLSHGLFPFSRYDFIRHFGSWTFVALFAATLLAWVGLNAWLMRSRGQSFDPYPYILLNLALSTLAALQAPVILMSQNRQAERDRINARYDYLVNRKAEKEIRNMQADLDEIKEMIRNLK